MPTKQRVVEHRREALDALRDSMMLAGLDAETADDSAATLLQHRPDLEAMGWLRFESILSELNDLIDQNRFWLGEDSYRNIGEYINLNHELMYEHSFGSGAPTPPWIARLDSLRSDIQKVSSSLLR